MGEIEVVGEFKLLERSVVAGIMVPDEEQAASRRAGTVAAITSNRLAVRTFMVDWVG